MVPICTDVRCPDLLLRKGYEMIELDRKSGEVSEFIQVRDLSLTYVGVDSTHTQALDRVCLGVPENDFISIIGPSGCGKTTLLKVLGDLLEPSAGEVRIAGRHPRDLREDQQIGYMFQDSVLLPWKTIRENIRFLSDIAGKPAPDETVEELAELVGLADSLNRYPHELSGGMRQRAALARAYALNPLIFLMDEPFGALDEITRHRMNRELLRIWSEHRKTVVFVTHSIGEAAFLSDNVIIMSSRPGRILTNLSIDLPRPRTGEMRYSQVMLEYVAELHDYLEQAEQSAEET
jgi:NitT/TauT family transport system ATP-binding protein